MARTQEEAAGAGEPAGSFPEHTFSFDLHASLLFVLSSHLKVLSDPTDFTENFVGWEKGELKGELQRLCGYKIIQVQAFTSSLD